MFTTSTDPIILVIDIKKSVGRFMNCDRSLGDWKAYLVEVSEDRLGCEPRKVIIGISLEEPRSAIDKVVGCIGLFDGDHPSFDSLIICINRAPFEVTLRCPNDAPQVVREWGEDLVRQARVHASKKWPDLDQRIAEKYARQACLKHLPDEAFVVQVCEVIGASGEALELAAFLVPRMASVVGGVHLSTVASMRADACDETMVNALMKMVQDGRHSFSYRPCTMASEDLVAVWRERFDGEGVLQSLHCTTLSEKGECPGSG